MRECHSNRTDGLARESKGKEEETKFLLHVLGFQLPPESVVQI